MFLYQICVMLYRSDVSLGMTSCTQNTQGTSFSGHSRWDMQPLTPGATPCTLERKCPHGDTLNTPRDSFQSGHPLGSHKANPDGNHHLRFKEPRQGLAAPQTDLTVTFATCCFWLNLITHPFHGQSTLLSTEM